MKSEQAYRKLIFVFLLTAIMILSNGCSHYYYAPSSHNVPAFKERGEVRLAIQRNSGDELRAFEIQSAFAVSNHIGLQLNYLYNSRKVGRELSKGEIGEFGIGYFSKFKEQIIWEIYGGGGVGEVYSEYEQPGYYSDMTFTKYYLQPSITIINTPGQLIDRSIGLSTRMALVKYNNVLHNLNEDVSEHWEVNYIEENRNFTLIEPALVGRAGWQFIMLQMQFGLSYCMNKSNFQQENTSFGVGIYFNVDKMFPKRN